MKAERVHHGSGSYIEPPLDQSWTDREKLEWQAAVVEVDSGLRISIHEDRGAFAVTCAGYGGSYLPFHESWRYMSTLGTGAEMFQRQQERAKSAYSQHDEPMDLQTQVEGG